MTQTEGIRTPASWVVVGLDNGGTTDNATVLDATGQFLVDRLVEIPSRVLDGPELAVEALADSFENIIRITNTPLTLVKAVGLDTPGPASAGGVISSKGATNFSAVSWHGFDIRAALERRLGLPVIYNNDATRPRCMPTTATSAPSRRCALRRSRASSVPGSAGEWSTTGG